MISLSTVTVVARTVSPGVTVVTVVAPEVMVVGRTVTDEAESTVWTGTLATVDLITTVCSVARGSVTGAVTDTGGRTVVPLCGVSVVAAGWIVVSTALGILVGNGCTDERPSVCRLVTIEPVVSGPVPVASVMVGT